MKKIKAQTRLKRLSDAFSGPPADVERNPASYDEGGGSFMHRGTCPACGHVNKDIGASTDGGEIICANCGKVFKGNLNLSTAPDEQFLTEPGRFAKMMHLRKALQKLGQRERRGPAQFTDLGDTIYDKLYFILEELEDTTLEEESTKAAKEFDLHLDSAQLTADSLGLMLGTLEGIIEDAVEGSELKELAGHVEEAKNTIASLEETLRNLQHVDIPWAGLVDLDEITLNITQLLDEVKRVGIDAKGGVTSPIDLADWLY